MMNNDMIQQIEYLREKANVSYEEAMNLLTKNNNDVMRTLIELEKHGRLFSQIDAGETQHVWQSYEDPNQNEIKEKAATFFSKVKRTRLVVQKKNKYGENETIANIGALTAAGVTIFAPYFSFATIILTLITGHQVKVETRD